jgi:DNA gyrase subunit B
VKKVIRLEKVLDILERKGRNRQLVTALARQGKFDGSVLNDRERLQDCVTEAEKYLGVAAPELLPISVEFEDDREHACLRLVASTRANGAQHRNVFDRELVTSAEFEEARRIARELAAVGDPPYTLGEGDAAELIPSLQRALERLMVTARKGLEIQRYKGLGEMNPSQLWETTMDPESRTLLQVKIEDAVEADIIFSTLMGDEVEPRRKFIEENALNVRNLDV